MSKNTTRKIELLCPAGDLDRLKTAVVFGADAVYCGLSDFSLRAARELNFTLETLQEGIDFAHAHGVKVYLTFNVFPHEWQVKEIENKLKEIKKKLSGIDGIILSDLGMLALVKRYLSGIEIHVSTQANTVNSEAIKIWNELGADRVVLARELTIDEIKDIKKKSPKVEIEVFGHGAMCMSYSGRCLLSKYFTGREANLGECAQPCRWRYKVKSEKLKVESCGVASPRIFIEEETRPGDLIEVQEDENGTYFMNSKDLCVLDILDQFIESGIDSLKIEGRTKSSFYVAVVTHIYRRAIDAYYELAKNEKRKTKNKGAPSAQYKKIIKELFEELNQIQNRGYSHGFILGRDDYEQEYDFAAIRPKVLPVGQIFQIKNEKSLQSGGQVKIKNDGVATRRYLVDVWNKFKVGEELEIMMPEGIYKVKIVKIVDEKDKELDEILKPKEKVWVEVDIKKDIPERSILRRKIK